MRAGRYAGPALLLDRAGVPPYIDPLRALPFSGAARGGVAQLVRVSACHAEGRGFEPRRSRHFLNENGSYLLVARPGAANWPLAVAPAFPSRNWPVFKNESQ